MRRLGSWSIAMVLGGLFSVGCGGVEPAVEDGEVDEAQQALGAFCTEVDDAYASYYTGANCTGTEYGMHTDSGGWDWNGQGCLRAASTSITANSMRNTAGQCMNWITHPTVGPVSIVVREANK